jgi:fatty acid desaturase
MSDDLGARARFPIRAGLTWWLGAALLAWIVWRVVNQLTEPGLIGWHLAATMPAQFMLCVCVHDAVHGVLIRPRSLNFAAGTLLALGVLLPFPLLRRTHLLHHETVHEPEDPERAVYAFGPLELILRLPSIPLIYMSNWRLLGRTEGAACAAAVAAIAGAVVGCALAFGVAATLGAVVAPSVATVAWFGFTTVYVPHSRHADRLMPYFTEHSGWHHDHHRAPQYPFNQYLELRDFHLRHGVFEPRGPEAAIVRALATRLWGERADAEEER